MIIWTAIALAGTPPAMNPAVETPPPASAETTETAETDDAALLGTLVLDVRMAAEIRLDGVILAKMFEAGRLEVETAIGGRRVVVIRKGMPEEIEVEVTPLARTVVLVGKNGLSSSKEKATPIEEGDATVEFRVTGPEGVMMVIDDDRIRIDGHSIHTMQVPVGEHSFSVRSDDGLVVWSRGRFRLTRANQALVLLSEGRVPEVSGKGASYHPGR